MNPPDRPEWLPDVLARLDRIEAAIQPAPLLFKFPAAARRLGVGLTKLKELVRKGEVRVTLLGRTPMVSLAELQQAAAPKEEKPRVDRANRRAAWVPIRRTPPGRR
jgi:hypothetical protein